MTVRSFTKGLRIGSTTSRVSFRKGKNSVGITSNVTILSILVNKELSTISWKKLARAFVFLCIREPDAVGVVVKDELKDESRFGQDVRQDLVGAFRFSIDVFQRDGWRLLERKL